MLLRKNFKGFCLLNMAENEEDYSSSTSEDDVDSLQSLEEDIESVPDQIAPYEGEPLASSDEMAKDLTRKTKEMKMG